MEEIRSTKDDMPNKDSDVICEICGNSIDENAEIELCPECISPFHKECWDKRGGCGNPKCISFVKPVDESKKATAKVVSVIIGKAKESLAKKEFDKALEFYKKALEYDSENAESINGLILAENSVCSTKELSKKGIEFEKSDSYKTYAEKLPEKNKKIFEEIIQNRSQSKEKKKKKLKTVIISVSSALAVILVAVCIWFATPMSRFNFEVNGNSVVITGVKFRNIKNAVIPEKISGKPVTSIGDYAFQDCTGLRSVTIPNSVTSIGGSAFEDCSGLTSIVIPNSVITIGKYAFYECTSLTSVTIPNSVTTIGSYAFYGCTSLTSIVIPNSVTSIGGSSTFYGCTGLTSIIVDEGNPRYKSIDGNLYSKDGNVLIKYAIGKKDTSFVIPSSVTTIGDSAFYGCTGLTSITIGDDVTKIGDGAFSGCTGLTSVTIPNSVTSIGGGAFGGCTMLTSVTIPNSVTEIGDSAFSGCTSLTSIVIPNSVTSIGKYVFNDCTGLTSVEIPNSVTSIGDYGFSDCTSLKSIVIPKRVTTIGNHAFMGCTGLTSIIVDKENPNYNSLDGNLCSKDGKTLILYAIGKKDTSFVIPSYVTTIDTFAFYGCTSLTSVTIPNRVTTIGYRAFEGCTYFTIYCEAESKPSGWHRDWNLSNCPVVWEYEEN